MSLGLTSKEAHIYVFFAQNIFNKKEEDLDKLGIGEKELKDNLQRLVEKGFIRIDPKDSNSFSVVPLDIVMEKLIKEKLEVVQKIKGEIKEQKSSP
jgi:sugar-specific transcriptional regulator TrmB